MFDYIHVHDLEVWSYLGVPEEERSHPQRLLITLRLALAPLKQAAETDDLTLTVNYHQVALRVKELAAERPRKLIETLAEDVARDLLNNFLVQQVTVEIKKFILRETKYVSVEMTRTKE